MPPPRRNLLLVALVTMTVVAAACSTPSPSASGSDGAASSTRPAATTPATADTSSGASGPTPGIATEPPPIALTEVAGGLDAPINVAAAPDGWLLVNERSGRVVAIEPDSGRASVALDFTDRVLGADERGLLGLALDPDWPDVPRAFVHYSDLDGDTVLSEVSATTTDGPPVLDPASERILLTVEQPYANHNGGQLAFGPDGYLYMGLGDGGSGGDPHENGQDRSTLLGKILRLDVAVGSDGQGAYRIPPDNPFADGSDGAPEVFLYGLRNPWRFSFDAAGGALWIADVGQGAWEEVDRIDPATEAGANLGWNVMEGSHCYATAGCSSDGLVLPVTEYAHDMGCSVSGGFVYRGSAIAGLAGWYLFSDYCSGLLFGVPSDAPIGTAPRILLETGLNVSAFGQDPEGELYLADIGGGAIYRIVGGG